jgi:ferrous iron transport protein B
MPPEAPEVAPASPTPAAALEPTVGEGRPSEFSRTETPERKIALVGNPNVGKSVIFNRLTGQYVYVSNYPGTTVALARGIAQFGGRRYEVVDTPGVNSLVPHSEDERVTRDILLQERPDIVLVVADAKNLRRTLLLLSQLVELGLPTVLDLNMADESRKRGIEVDADSLRRLFGIPVVETVATEGHGIRELERALAEPVVPRNPSPELKAVVAELERDVLSGQGGPLERTEPNGSALPMGLFAEWLGSGDDGVKGTLPALFGKERLDAIQRSLGLYQQRHRRPPAAAIVQARGTWIDGAVSGLRRVKVGEVSAMADRLGRWCREPLTGFPILFGVLLFMYYFVGVFGAGTAVDFLESTVFGEYFVPAITWIVDRLLPFAFVRDLLVGPYGAISMGLTYSVAIVLPVVTTFFLAFGFLEDSGYLPRLAVLADRMFRFMGLNGKAVLPMVLGLGCVTMATLTTRILSTRKERLLATLLLALAVPCAAQLGVVLGMLAWVSFSALLFLAGILLSQLLLVGWIADKIIPGARSDFMVELPPMRLPMWSNLARKTWSRVRWFLREAVPLFVLGTVMLFILDRLGILPFIVRAAEPVVVGLLGLPAKAGEAFVMGFLRRDYGAAGLFDLARQGMMDHTQIMVSLVTMTLFVPCVANFFVMVKEHDFRKAALMVGFIIPYAIAVGAGVNFFLRWTGLEL